MVGENPWADKEEGRFGAGRMKSSVRHGFSRYRGRAPGFMLGIQVVPRYFAALSIAWGGLFLGKENDYGNRTA